MRRPLLRCPCGYQPDQATWTRGQTTPDGPRTPDRIALEPCGHAFEAPSPEYATLAVAIMRAAEQPEGSDRG